MDIKEAIETKKAWMKNRRDFGARMVDLADDILLSFAEKIQHPGSFCDICWTSSWTPYPKNHPHTQKVLKSKDSYVICQMCQADRYIAEMQKEIEELKGALDKAHKIFGAESDKLKELAKHPAIDEGKIRKALIFLATDENGVRHSTDLMDMTVINKVIAAIKKSLEGGA